MERQITKEEFAYLSSRLDELKMNGGTLVKEKYSEHFAQFVRLCNPELYQSMRCGEPWEGHVAFAAQPTNVKILRALHAIDHALGVLKDLKECDPLTDIPSDGLDEFFESVNMAEEDLEKAYTTLNMLNV